MKAHPLSSCTGSIGGKSRPHIWVAPPPHWHPCLPPMSAQAVPMVNTVWPEDINWARQSPALKSETEAIVTIVMPLSNLESAWRIAEDSPHCCKIIHDL